MVFDAGLEASMERFAASPLERERTARMTFGGVETYEVSCCFEGETGICACYNYCLAAEIMFWVGKGDEELGVKEVEEP